MFSRLISLLKCQGTDYEKELQHNAESTVLYTVVHALLLLLLLLIKWTYSTFFLFSVRTMS